MAPSRNALMFPPLSVAIAAFPKSRLNVDIWAGNHPFYTGSQKILDTEGRVERFMRKYGIENQTE